MELASMMKWDLHQMNVNTSFLNGVIEEEVYIKQPQGFQVEDTGTHTCKLKKYLYGLKQAPRAWYGRIDSFLTSLGFTKSKVDPNFYFKVIEDEPGILLLYVDDRFFYAVEILKRFDMLECKAMATPMDSNLKLLR